MKRKEKNFSLTQRSQAVMETNQPRYEVELSQAQRHFLTQLTKKGHSGAPQQTAARILLLLDESEGRQRMSDGKIAKAVDVCRQTVIRTKKRWTQGGLERALYKGYAREQPDRRRLDGEGEARLSAIACSQAPDGREGWTLRMLADRLIQLQVVERISPDTVRRYLKKTN
jgi:transposase